MEPTATASRRRRRDERGSAVLEFALVGTLLMTLLLGIVVFGILLYKRQVLTQSVAEGARVAVPYQYSAGNTSNLTTAAKAQVDKGLLPMSRACGDTATTCTFIVYSCSGTVSPPSTPTGAGDCLQVSVVLDVKGGPNPLVPNVAGINVFLPSTMTSTFTVTLANPT